MPIVTEHDYAILADVVSRLDRAGIPYMLTGSIAMNYYAQPRQSRDFDLVVELAGSDAGRVVGMFSDDYYVSDEAVRDALRRRTLFNLVHLGTSVKVDVIVGDPPDPFHASQMSRRRRIEILPGMTVWTISCEDLILSKALFSVSHPWSKDDPSPRQTADVANLLDSCRDLDTAYVSAWADRIGVADVLAAAGGDGVA